MFYDGGFLMYLSRLLRATVLVARVYTCMHGKVPWQEVLSVWHHEGGMM